ncbi:MAG: hypothetical protein K5931_07550, partial [Lachnospiraceae bacterium]|nr:hypothetical protein [Lachnospiraceae bacterium]
LAAAQAAIAQGSCKGKKASSAKADKACDGRDRKKEIHEKAAQVTEAAMDVAVEVAKVSKNVVKAGVAGIKAGVEAGVEASAEAYKNGKNNG